MNKVNLGDKYDKRLTLRLTTEQLEFLVEVSERLDCSPSDYLRMTINSARLDYKRICDSLFNEIERKVGTLEHVKTDINNQL